MSERLRKQAEQAQAEQQRQAQQAAEARAGEEKRHQEDEARREKERRKPKEEHCFEDVETRYYYARKLLEGYLQERESAAMSRYEAHQKEISEKVEQHLKEGQNRTQTEEKAFEHSR